MFIPYLRESSDLLLLWVLNGNTHITIISDSSREEKVHSRSSPHRAGSCLWPLRPKQNIYLYIRKNSLPIGFLDGCIGSLLTVKKSGAAALTQ